MCSDTFDSYDQHYGRGLVKDTIKDGMCVYVYASVRLYVCLSCVLLKVFTNTFTTDSAGVTAQEGAFRITLK